MVHGSTHRFILFTDHVYKTTMKLSDYFGQVDSGRNINIQAYAIVKASRSRPIQNCVKSHDVEFSTPKLEVKVCVGYDVIF